MFGRLRLISRIVLIVILFLLTFVAFGIVLSQIAVRDKSQSLSRFPIPGQIAAIIDLLDTTPPARISKTLQAIRTPELSISIQKQDLKGFSELDRMPGLEWLISQYLESLQGRKILAVREYSPNTNLFLRFLDRLNAHTRTPVNIAVELKNGRYAILKVRDSSSHRLFGVPVGFWIGFFGFLFAAVALWAIAREAKPIQQLSNVVTSFGDDIEPRIIEPEGAPEIKKLIIAVNSMQQRIATLLKARSILLGGISHDLKTYITRLRLRVEDLPSETKQQKAVQDVEDMTRIVNDAVAIAKGNFGKKHCDTIELSSLIGEEVSLKDRKCLHYVQPEDSYIISGDLMGVRRVLNNIMDNALKYSENVYITLHQHNGEFCIAVDDDGIGIPENARAYIFEPFYRIEDSRNLSSGGSGLGLAIAKQIVDAHKGDIKVKPSKKGGALFEVYFPKNN